MHDYQAGIDAFNRGDYSTALKVWQQLAEQGYSEAQYILGGSYYLGEVVSQDYAEAAR